MLLGEIRFPTGARQRISLDLDDGVKVNYGKFGGLLAEVSTVTGGSEWELIWKSHWSANRSLTNSRRSRPAWLSAFDPRYRKNWEKLLNAEEESAFAEARVRQLLQGHGVSVEPNEDLDGSTPQPDFRCYAGGDKFYIEVACVPTAVATEKTGIPNGPHRCSTCRPLNDAIFAKCRGKAAQCKDLDAPALVAIGTFHRFAAMSFFDKPILNWVLTGEAKIAWEIDTRTGKQAGDTHQITELHSAAFLCPDKTLEVGYARSSISGLLLCGLPLTKRTLIGVLHPNPARPFDPAILPKVEFGQVAIDRASRQLHVAWPKGDYESDRHRLVDSGFISRRRSPRAANAGESPR